MDPWITDDLGKSYPNLLNWLQTAGWELEGRGGKVKEVPDFTLELLNPRKCVVSRPGFSRRFMELEIAMLLAGVYDAKLTMAVSPVAAGLITPLTAYGPRVRAQMPWALRELEEDPNSRRAVVYIGQEDDLRTLHSASGRLERAGEMPCTCLWQFLAREGRLHMIVYMRSWDAVWGLCYDVPCFVGVQIAAARALKLPLGEYHHHAGSFHIYEHHYGIQAEAQDKPLELDVGDSWEETREKAGEWLRHLREEVLVDAPDQS